MRAALGLSNEPPKKQKAEKIPSSGNMQVTFTAGLSSANDAGADGDSKASVFTNKPSDVNEETTVEKYIRKERERKSKRKVKGKARPDAADGSNTKLENGEEDHAGKKSSAPHNSDGEDPFADPFFADPMAANARARKDHKREKKRRTEKEATADENRKIQERRELELLVNEDGNGKGQHNHFDMAAIKQGEKIAKKSKRFKTKKTCGRDEAEEKNLQQEDFELNVNDPRFQGLGM